MVEARGIPEKLVSRTQYFDSKAPMTKVISSLARYPAVVVNKDKEYYGIVDSRAVYRMRRNLRMSRQSNVGALAVRVPKVTKSTSLDDLVSYFYRTRVKALPFMSGKRITGVIERKTLLKMLLSYNLLSGMRVDEAMTTPVLAIDHMASIAQAKTAMEANKVNRLVVVDDERFIGIVTNYDITRSGAKVEERLPEMKAKAYNASTIRVDSVVRHTPVVVEATRGISDAVREMVERGISSLVVLRKSRPVGILTITDVLERVIARRRIEERKVFMSGFDAQTYDYEDEVREGLKSFIDEVEKLRGMRVDYVTFRVKRIKVKSYEIQIRVSLGRNGIVSVRTSQFTFWEAYGDIMKKLRKGIIRGKERKLTWRKVNTLREMEEEGE